MVIVVAEMVVKQELVIDYERVKVLEVNYLVGNIFVNDLDAIYVDYGVIWFHIYKQIENLRTT